VLLLEAFSGTEAISKPFAYTLKLLSENPAVSLKDLLSKPVVVSIELADGSDRHLHGLISRIAQAEYGDDGLVAYEAEMVPWIWFLTLFTDCRIFQNKSVPEIVEQVFHDRGFTDFKLQLQGSYPKRDYCVQYRETDLNFVSRLLEEEGIFYFFQHDQQKHTLVLGDKPSAIEDCPKQEKAQYWHTASAVQGDDTVSTLLHEQKVYAGISSLNDYDFEKPKTSLLASVSSDQKGEVYDYPGKYTTKDDGDRYAKIRLEEQTVQLSMVRGDSLCRAFQAGYKSTLEDHYRDDENQAYTILAVSHQAQNTSYRSGSQSQYHYQNRFEAIPNSVPFRPSRLARKPVIEGSQTAVVVGKSGEEIWTDKYGRVKVQFYWDRAGVDDENSSCWIRVAQTVAGKGWGAIYIPRIGQEVIVDFLEGDPDRPIITGRVYNADQTVPYSLPGEQTKSSYKSMSSKGGGGFNEIRFEDKKGDEQVFIHGEKDLDIRIKKDRKEFIGQDTHLIVEQDQIEKVKGDKHLQVTGDKNERVDGTVSLKAGMDMQQKVGMNYALDSGMEVHIKSGMNLVIETGATLTLKVGGNYININPGGVFITGTMVMINSGGAAGSGAGASPQAPKDPKEADKADPGQMSQPGSGSAHKPAKMKLETLSPAAAVLRAAAHSGAPFCET
jgi:type VI secretion system secreted protein VgrG